MAAIIKRFIKRTQEFRSLKKEAKDAFAAFTDGADADYTIFRLADIGRRMERLVD